MKKIQALENNPLLNLQKKEKNFEIYGPAKDDDNKKSKKKNCQVQNRGLFNIILLIHYKNLKDYDMDMISENLNELT